MPANVITSVGPHKQFPYLPNLKGSVGCPGAGAGQPQLSGAQIPGQLRVTRVRIAGGDRGIAQTIGYMTAAVMSNEGVYHPEVIRTATQIVGKVPSRDQAGEIAAVLQWVKQNIAFRGEYKERIQTPYVTLMLRSGDCDCQTVLSAALLLNLGFRVRFKTVAADPAFPQFFSHVYLEIYQRKTDSWIALDPTVPQSYPGWAPQKVFRSKAYHPLGDPPQDPSSAPASSGSGSTVQEIISQIAAPIAQGVAQRIAYSGNNLAPGRGVGISANVTAGGISPTALYVGGSIALVTLVALAFGGRRGN